MISRRRLLPDRAIPAMAGIAVLVFGLAWFGLSLARSGWGYAPLWLANAAVTALLLRFAALPRPASLVVTYFSLIAANFVTGSPTGIILSLAGANLLEVVTALALMHRFARSEEPVFSPRYLAKFMVLAGGIAPIIGAASGGLALAMIAGGDAWSVALHWFAADSLGMLIVGPIVLAACNPDCRAQFKAGKRIEAAVVMAAVAILTALIFGQSRYPVLFLLLPVLTVAAFRLRFMGATGSILILAAIASWLTLNGQGPITAQFAIPGERILFLQAFLAVAVVSTLPVAATLVERERLLTRLRTRERQYRLLADHSSDMIVRLDLDGLRTYVSPAATTILGYAPDELVGRRAEDDVHPDDQAMVVRCRASLLDGVENPTCIYRQRRRDGDHVWLEASYRLIRDHAGAASGIVASVRDVSRRRTAEIESTRAVGQLQESLRLLSMAERMAGIGHWRLDARDRTLFWSEQVHRIHGRASGDTPELDRAIDVYHPDDRAQIVAHVETALAQGAPWSFRARIIRADGEVRRVESSGQPEIAPDGEVLGIVGVFRDVTDEAAAEAALIAARDEARALAEAKSAFLATMSHEIRTPMTGVLGMIELLRADPDPAEQQRYLENLEQSATLLMTVLDDVLDFSKIEKGALTLERIDFDLGELARTTLDLFHHGASSKGLNLNLSVPVGRDLRARGDPVRLRQIVANLVSNAIKFTASGSVDVTLDLRHDGATRIARWRVADTGVGIDPDALPRLFEPFVQADASTTRRFGGTGLGLAISRRLVEAMGGQITIESRPGQGAIFAFEVQLEAPGIATAPAPTAAPRPSRSLSILLAEDNAINRALVTALVRRDGHEIVCTENGRFAVEAAATRRFDVILMDMQMPEMDGLTATRTIRRGNGPNADVPIIALTADAAPERRVLYENAGLSALLNKPVDSARLSAQLRAIADEPVTAATVQPPPPAEAAAALNTAKLDTLTASIGAGNVARLLDMMSDEVTARPPVIARLIAIDSRMAVAAEAHALKGASLNIGADWLADVACRIEGACADDRPLSPLADELLDAARATMAAIDRRRGMGQAA